jgi:protease-4
MTEPTHQSDFRIPPQINLPTSSHQPQYDLYKVLETTLQASIIEQRRGRRWGIFFKTIGIVLTLIILSVLMNPLDFSGINQQTSTLIDNPSAPYKRHTAVVRLNGVIASEADANAYELMSNLGRAFNDPHTDAVILEINSGGGSPVQSGYVYDEIKRLRKIYPSIKLYAVIADIGASGAYYIAAAADEIYADKASLVGSIGVTGASFGFVDSMKMLGVERRAYTSGEHKAFLDPFQIMNPIETEFWKNQLNHIHEQFIKVVKDGRGARLKETAQTFSGLIWNGENALEMGLIDGLGSPYFLAREIIKSPKMVLFSSELSTFDRMVKKFGASIGTQLSNQMGLNGISLK